MAGWDRAAARCTVHAIWRRACPVEVEERGHRAGIARARGPRVVACEASGGERFIRAMGLAGSFSLRLTRRSPQII